MTCERWMRASAWVSALALYPSCSPLHAMKKPRWRIHFEVESSTVALNLYILRKSGKIPLFWLRRGGTSVVKYRQNGYGREGLRIPDYFDF